MIRFIFKYKLLHLQGDPAVGFGIWPCITPRVQKEWLPAKTISMGVSHCYGSFVVFLYFNIHPPKNSGIQ